MTLKPSEYVTTIAPVLEVTLIGTADRAALTPYLQTEEQRIRHGQDRTAIVISSVDARYYGIHFQELSISIQLDQSEFFLAHAYNSLPTFAFVERVMFRTPYHPGKIAVHPRHISLTDKQALVFDARLPDNAALVRSESQPEEFMVCLPKSLRKNPSQPHYFYAQLEGAADFYSVSADTVTISPDTAAPIWKLLRESGFQAEHWRVRAAACHRKSKTFLGVPS